MILGVRTSFPSSKTTVISTIPWGSTASVSSGVPTHSLVYSSEMSSRLPLALVIAQYPRRCPHIGVSLPQGVFPRTPYRRSSSQKSTSPDIGEQGLEKTPAQAHRGHKDKILVLCLLDAHHFLDLLGQGFLLFFLLSPTTIMVLMPMASFLLHQPALGDSARLFLKLAVLLRVAHWRSPPSSLATPAVVIREPLPTGTGH